MTINFLRYPGGKSKVLKKIVPRIVNMLRPGDTYSEPFIGGGSVALAVAEAVPGVALRLNDADPGVAAVWRTLASGRVEALVMALDEMEPTVALFRRLMKARPRNMVDRAARFVALNRMAFSGKAHTTPIGGWDQTGRWKIGAEWRREHVRSNIRRAANALSTHDVTVTSLDFSCVLRQRDVIYVDPPYYHRGGNMYAVAMSPSEHAALSIWLRAAPRWLASYDDCAEVRKLFRGCLIAEDGWTYSAGIGPNYKGRELLIGPAVSSIMKHPC